MAYSKPIRFDFPPPEEASEDGLLTFGGSLCEDALLQAYKEGIFPWYDENNPIIWWSPDPRMILFPNEFHTSKRLKRRINQQTLQVSYNQAFREVMLACAQPRKDQDSTWILSDMVEAYCTMFKRGHGFSIEVWENGHLCGGVYGLNIGKAWFAESMFHTRIDASKIALFYLVEHVKKHQGHFIDCQMHTSHLESLGAREVPRATYLELLAKAVT